MDIDKILRHALSPKDKPAADINRQLLSKIKEENSMERRVFVKSPVVAALAAVVILVAGSVSAYAAWKYLTPSEVARIVEDNGLAKAFHSEDAVIINKTVSDYDFDVTLLGMVSGKALSSLPMEQIEFTAIAGRESGAWDRVKEDSTYCVIAVKYSGTESRGRVVSDKQHPGGIYGQDGTVSNPGFYVSPFIQGQKPWECNIWSMGGGTAIYEEDGVYYQIIRCDDLEVFAGRTVYVGVTDTDLIDGSVYGYNKNTGEISSQEGWPGLNVLFTLPFDKRAADDKRADGLLKQWQEDAWAGAGENQYTFRDGEWKMKKETAWTAEDVLEKGRPIKGTKQILSIDSYGLTSEALPWEYRGVKALAGSYGITNWFYDSEGNSVENSWKNSAGESKKYYAALPVEKGAAAIVSAAAFKRGTKDSVEEFRVYQVLTWNGDGTVTYCAYYA